jgi:hypothetical protein
MSRWVALAIAVAACGHAAPAPAPVTTPLVAPAPPDAAPPPVALEDDLPRLAERGTEVYAGWQRALDEAAGDCAAATAKINALVDANADVIAANRKVLASGDAKIEQLRAALQSHEAELDAHANAITHSPTMAACKDDAAFAHAIDRLGGES